MLNKFRKSLDVDTQYIIGTLLINKCTNYFRSSKMALVDLSLPEEFYNFEEF